MNMTERSVFSFGAGYRRISPAMAIKSLAMNFPNMGFMFKNKSRCIFYFNCHLQARTLGVNRRLIKHQRKQNRHPRMDNPEAHQEMKQIKTAKKSEQHESYRKHGKWNQVLAENKQFLFLIRHSLIIKCGDRGQKTPST